MKSLRQQRRRERQRQRRRQRKGKKFDQKRWAKNEIELFNKDESI